MAKVVFSMLISAICGMLLLPWQQMSKATGRVIAYVPQERQQTVDSPLSAQVSWILPNLREGDHVKKGQHILTLSPIAENMPEMLENQRSDLQGKIAAIDFKIANFKANVIEFEKARDFTVDAAQDMIDSAISVLESEKKLIAGLESMQVQADLNYKRGSKLVGRGATAPMEVEKLERDLEVAKANLASQHDKVKAAEQMVEARKKELEERRSRAQASVETAKASEQSAISERASVQKELRDVEIKLDELRQTDIFAPRDGTIFRLPVFERGQIVSAGSPLFTIVPDTTDLAVELLVNGLDIPLVEIDDHVRLQFEGWPAIQMPGYPSLAINTFGGKVVAIDETDDGNGRFRIQVLPDPEDSWPHPIYRRQGVRVNGWVILKQVSLGFELWRLMNGFPPYRSDGTFEKRFIPKIKID